MKLIIQIPCYNEEKTLPVTLAGLPKEIDGIDTIEVQIIDDGSTDRTIEVARKFGVDYIVSFKKNRGLAAAFKAGVDNALRNNADVLVNTDGDNQYYGGDIIELIRPIINGEADIVIGCRLISAHPDFSLFKKNLQRIGSWVLGKISNTGIRDVTSGFRAYNREAMLHMNIFSVFSYCLETLIQAGYNNLKISNVDIRVNPKTRESRLFKSNFEYILKSLKTIISIFIIYRSNFFFTFISLLMLFFCAALFFRYLILISLFNSPAGSFWPSIIVAGIFLTAGIFFYLTGILATLIASNRKLEEDIIYRIKKIEIGRLDKFNKNYKRVVDRECAG